MTPGRTLEGLEVVECATFVAGPTCGMTLAQLGASVVRVDLPGGGSDFGRWPLSRSGASLYWTNLNKGKRSVALDYRTPEGRELLLALATREGPGRGIYLDNVVGRNRVTHADLTARRADAISVHVEGFPGGRPAVDYTVNASVGIADMTGPEFLDTPVNHVLPAWDLLTGLHASVAVLAALQKRRAEGTGSHVDLALYDVAVSSVGALGWFAEADEAGHSRQRHGNHVFGSFGTDFASRDGERVMVVALTEGQWNALCAVTGTVDVFAALEKALDVDLRHEAARYELRETIASILRPWFAARPIDDLAPLLDEARVLWAPYLSVDQAGRVARAAAHPVLRDIEQPGVGRMAASSSPLRWDDDEAWPAPAPELGSDTLAVLTEQLGLGDAEIGGLRDRGVIDRQDVA